MRLHLQETTRTVTHQPAGAPHAHRCAARAAAAGAFQTPGMPAPARLPLRIGCHSALHPRGVRDRLVQRSGVLGQQPCCSSPASSLQWSAIRRMHLAATPVNDNAVFSTLQELAASHPVRVRGGGGRLVFASACGGQARSPLHSAVTATRQGLTHL